MKRAYILGFGCLVVLAGIYLSFVNYLRPFEEGIAWNFITGELCLQGKGLNFTAPWVMIARVDARPIRVCVTTTGRGFNCKLVQFEPSAFKEFVATEGFRYYWWANRLSYNYGYDEEYRGMKDILRGYAYGVKKYPFVTVVRDYEAPD